MLGSILAGAAVLSAFLMGRASARVAIPTPLVLPAAPSDAQLEAALGGLLAGQWEGDAGSIGRTQPRSMWRSGMRQALRAAASGELADHG